VTPRKSHDGRVPRWLYRSRGKIRKAIVEGPYDCPVCGKHNLKIRIDKSNKIVEATCICGLSRDLKFRSMLEPVDYYAEIVDQYYNR